jgi:hypothetical protein
MRAARMERLAFGVVLLTVAAVFYFVFAWRPK